VVTAERNNFVFCIKAGIVVDCFIDWDVEPQTILRGAGRGSHLHIHTCIASCITEWVTVTQCVLWSMVCYTLSFSGFHTKGGKNKKKLVLR
jgi:hypothetical protein